MSQSKNTKLENSSIEKLERQVERGQFFTHTALGEGFARVGETSAFVHGLIDLMLSKNLFTEEDLQAAIVNVRQQMSKQGELSGPGTAIRPETGMEKANDVVQVNCNDRMHICKAVCCKLNFALTVNEIELGKAKWDLGRPYFIRHEADGYCTHLKQSCGNCGIYESRPGVCRHYSCANDFRIWKDFEKMELNTEWISVNLPPDAEERRIGTIMQ